MQATSSISSCLKGVKILLNFYEHLQILNLQFWWIVGFYGCSLNNFGYSIHCNRKMSRHITYFFEPLAITVTSLQSLSYVNEKTNSFHLISIESGWVYTVTLEFLNHKSWQFSVIWLVVMCLAWLWAIEICKMNGSYNNISPHEVVSLYTVTFLCSAKEIYRVTCLACFLFLFNFGKNDPRPFLRIIIIMHRHGQYLTAFPMTQPRSNKDRD